jgi:hypothetical protein
MPRYKIYQSGNKVIAVSSFAGRAVRGIAKCDPTDEFSFEVGKNLAEARCNVNVAEKRAKYAAARINDAIEWYNEAAKYLEKQIARGQDAADRLVVAKKNLDELLKTI